jgi:PAS domain S-box-containing protein
VRLPSLNISAKISVAFLLVAAALIVGIGVPAYLGGRASLKAAAFAQLASTASEKGAALDSYVGERKDDLSAIAASPALLQSVAALSGPGTAAAHDRVVAELGVRVSLDKPYAIFMVLDPGTGEVIASTDPAEEGKFRESQPYFLNGKTGAFVQGVYYSTSTQGPAMAASAPLRSSDGRLLGVLVASLNLEEVNAIVQRRGGQATTIDAFLVNTSSLFVTQPRYVSDPAVLQRGIQTEAATQVLAGRNGTLAAKDYRGVPALIAYRWLPTIQVGLIAKIDQSEAFAPLRTLRDTILIAVILVLLAVAALAYWLVRTIARPMRGLVKGALEIGGGKLETHVSIRSRDETGQLATAFTQMAENLQATMVSRDLLAEEVGHRLRAEEGLRASERRYQSLVDLSPDAILVNAGGTFVFANPAAAKLYGANSPDEVIGRRAMELTHPDYRERMSERTSEVLAGAVAPPEEIAVLRLDGAPVDVEALAARTEFDGEPAAQVVLRDTTERKQAQQQIERALAELRRSNQDLEQFAYVASHDLQEPLRMVASYTQLLAQRYEGQLDDQAQTYIHYATDGATRMQQLINDLLTYSRVGARGQELAPTDLHSVLGEALRDLAAAIHESRAVVTNGDLPTVLADAGQLRQVFQNLIGNAIKFRREASPCVHVSARKEGREWIVCIKDNGIGIDVKHADKLFVIFQRLHTRQEFPGTGIGLALCRRIVERHGGRIWFESKPGEGSIFYFSLPA